MTDPKAVNPAAGTRRAPNHVVAAAEARLRAIAEDEARQKKLYGDHIEDMLVLRRRGFEVTAVEKDRYRVGNHVIDGEALKAKADRERRLIGEAGEVRTPA